MNEVLAGRRSLGNPALESVTETAQNPALETDQNACFAYVLPAQLKRCTKPLRGSSPSDILPIG